MRHSIAEWKRKDVVVVGAGLAGLVAAQDLTAAGLDVLVLDRADRVGGRVVTDEVDGFVVDRGFQVLNTSYPQVRKRIDLDALDARRLTAGALIRYDGRLRRVGNPLRDPASVPSQVSGHLLSPADVFRLSRYSARAGMRSAALPAVWPRRQRRPGLPRGRARRRADRAFPGTRSCQASCSTASW